MDEYYCKNDIFAGICNRGYVMVECHYKIYNI